MKGKINLLARKIFATAIALAMSIPPQAFATEEGPVIYDANSSIMGINEEETDNILVHNQDENQDQTQTHLEFTDYDIEISTNLEPTLTELTYTIKAKRKQSLEEDDANLTLNLTKVANSNIRDLRLVEASTEVEETYNEAQTDLLDSLHLTSKAADEIIYTLKANVNKAKNERTYDLILSLSEAEKTPDLASYKLKTQEKTIIEDEQEKTIFSLTHDENEKSNPKGVYKEEGLFGGLFAKKDTITWTDYILNADENKEFTYDFKLDDKQETENAKIALDYYEVAEHGFEIKKEFSQEIDFAKKINFEIPQNFIAKITLTTQVDKKNTNVENYSLNNRMTKNPIYIEGNEEKSSDDDEADGKANTEETTEEANKEETPVAETEEKAAEENKTDSQGETKEENKEESKDDTSESKEEKEEKPAEEKSEIVIDDAKSQEDEKEKEENQISALILNKDSLLSKLEAEDKLTDELKTAIEDLAEDLDSYNDEKITDQDLKDFTKALAERNSIAKADLREYFESILSGLNKQTNKAANLNIDEIIDYAYPEEKDQEKTEETEDTEKSETEELTNLEKADKELKEALADEKNGLEEIQALLDSFEEKYNLTREEQEKLMEDNNEAISALVDKDREENTRFNNLRATDSFGDKKFRLKTSMNIIATKARPMPEGWYFDVYVGDYLKEDWANPIQPLKVGGKEIATGTYISDAHKIRYVINERLTSKMTLPIDQILAFDTEAIGNQDPIDIKISVQPRGMSPQNIDSITVPKSDTRKEITSETGKFDFNSPKNISSQVTYPVILEYHTKQRLMDAKTGQPANIGWGLNQQDLEVWWDIEVETDKLFPDGQVLNFNNLNFNLFASGRQGLENGKYKISNNKDDLDDTTEGYKNITGSGGDLMQASEQIDRNNLSPDRVYIRVKLPLKDNEYHSKYSLGLRVTPDNNFIKTIYEKFVDDYNKLPTILKFMRGGEDAEKYSSLPFNLVEDMFVADFPSLNDPKVDENFYYDRTRTIVAEDNRDTFTTRRWYAMDLLRVGETEDYGLANANLIPKALQYTKAYYVPKIDGEYYKVTDENKAKLPDGSFIPGVIVYYDYKVQKGSQDTHFQMDVNLKEKPIDNSDVINKYQDIDTEGGMQNLYSRKLREDEISYYAYLELPYLIMRINKTFEMVQCLNAGKPDPTVNQRPKISLDRIENPTGEMLYTNINPTDVRVAFVRDGLEPGGQFNRNYLTREDAAEDLFKRIYFYADEVKSQYPAEHGGKEMHRMIENQMLQRLIHYFTSGMRLTEEYEYIGVPTEDSYKYHQDRTLTDTKGGNSFDGEKDNHIDGQGYRRLAENEELIVESGDLKGTQVKYAQEVLNRVLDSYQNKTWENENIAKTVKLVYYDHGLNKWQRLITAQVTRPLTAYKVDEDDNQLDGAEFEFVNNGTGEVVNWTSSKDDKKVYLTEGEYVVKETKAPEGYELIKPFKITVKNEEILPDNGTYNEIAMRIRVNNGFKTTNTLSNVPKDINNKDLVKQNGDKLEIEIVDESNKLGKLRFTKVNGSGVLDGSEFTLTKIKSADNTTTYLGSDGQPVYKKTSAGTNGAFEFSRMPVGYYLLEETKVPRGYKKAANQIIEVKLEKIDGVERAVTRFLDDKIEFSKAIENEPITTSMKLRKVDEKDTKIRLENARFRMYSERTIDGIDFNEEFVTDQFGIAEFTGIKEGEYIVIETVAPTGYHSPQSLPEPDKFFGWKVFVKYNDQTGKLDYSIYKLKYRTDARKKESELKGNEVNIPDVLDGDALNVPNEIRKVDWEFRKYIENTEFDPTQQESETNPKYIPFPSDKIGAVRFNLYKADYYGSIVGINSPVIEGIKADPNGVFHLKGLEYNTTYALREVGIPQGYDAISDLTLKVESDTVGQEVKMRVVVRDPTNASLLGPQGVLRGVINYPKGAKLGKLAIKKTGRSLWGPDHGKEVGLRRAFFRLYTADDNFEIKMNDAGYAESYSQESTEGWALTDEKGNPRDSSRLPEDQGIAVFRNIKPGKYVLVEHRGPAGYEKDTRPIYVLVDKDGNVFKSRDKSDPILQANSANARRAPMIRDASTPLRAGANDTNQAVTKTYEGQYATVKITAGDIDTSKGTRRMKVEVTAKDSTIDLTIGFNKDIKSPSYKFSDYDHVINYPAQKFFTKGNLGAYSSFSAEFDANLEDFSATDEYLPILNKLQVYSQWYRRTETFNQAFEDFKVMRKSNYNKAKVEFTYLYYDYDKTGVKPNPYLIDTGEIWLQRKENGSWVDVPDTKTTAYKNSINDNEFPEFKNLDKNKEYRIAYQLSKGNQLEYLFDWPDKVNRMAYYYIDQSKADENGLIKVNIVNGNLLKIFNEDENGFRIPLRIEKEDEKGSLIKGAQFKAKKLVDGEKAEGHDDFPKYYDEPYDGFTEATGRTGENYFRELTPGIYELWEEQAPNGYNKLTNKWYFKVVVDPSKKPSDADYMQIKFDFSYQFPLDLSDKKYEHLTNADKQRLRGRTIFGIGANENTTYDDQRLPEDAYKNFIRNVKIKPDNHISQPARPDAPYQGIDVVGVTNHSKTTVLDFKKTGINNASLEGAKFQLTKVRVLSNGDLLIKSTDQLPDPELLPNSNQKAYDVTKTSQGILGISFDGITKGTYILQEIEAPSGYQRPKSFIVIRFKEDENGKLVYEIDRRQSDSEFLKLLSLDKNNQITSIRNKDNLAELRFSKVNAQGQSVGTSAFNLQAVDKDGKVLLDKNNNPVYDELLERFNDFTEYKFTGLKAGRYKLTEINYTIYAKPHPWYFNVEKGDDGNLRVKFEDKNDQSIIANKDGTYKIVNYAKTNFSFYKMGQGLDSPPIPLSGIYFTFKKVRADSNGNGIKITYDADGNVKSMTDSKGNELIEKSPEGYIQNPQILSYGYYKQYRTWNDGYINFDGLSPGIYELEEITKHESFNQNTQRRWIVKVEPADGKLKVKYDKNYEEEYYQKYDDKYYKEIYVPRNFSGSNLLTGSENEGFKVINVRNKVDIKWRKVDSKTGAVIHDIKAAEKGLYDDKNAIFELHTLHSGIVEDDSNQFKDILVGRGSGSTTRPPQIYSVEGNYALYGVEPGVYAITETKYPTGYITRNQISLIILVTEKGKLKPGDKNYEANSKELVYKLYEVQFKYTGLGQPPTILKLTDNPKEFELIRADNDGNIIFNKDGFFDYTNEPDENKGSFIIEKKDSKNRSLAGAVFDLIDTKGEVIRQAKSDEDGKLVFSGLDPGKFTLKESQPPIGFKQSESVWTVFVLDNGHTFIVDGETDQSPQDVTNYERPSKVIKNTPIQETGEFTISKFDNEKKPLEGASFKLEKTKDAEGDEITPTITIGEKTSDDKGKILFEKLEPGTYELTETKAPDDYIIVADKWTITVGKDGKTTVENPTENAFARSIKKFADVINPAKLLRAPDAEEPIVDIPVINKKQITASFQIKKTGEENQTLSGAEFELVRVKDEANQDITGEKPIVAVSGEDGLAKFDKLLPGVYELTETKAPTGYKKVDGKYIVTVTKDGDKASVKIKEPSTTKYEYTAKTQNSQQERIFQVSPNGYWYPEAKVSQTIAKTQNDGEYKLTINYEPLYEYDNYTRLLRLVFDTDNFEVYDTNGYPISYFDQYFYTSSAYSSRPISFIVKSKDPSKEGELQPVKYFKWDALEENAPQYFAKVIQKKIETEVEGEEKTLTGETLEYNLANEKNKYQAEFIKIGVGKERDPNELLEGAVFLLQKKDEEDGIFKNFTDMRYISDSQGRIILKDLEVGEYRLRETRPPEGYRPPTNIYVKEFKIDENGNTLVKDASGAYVDQDDTNKNIINEKYGTESYTFYKTDGETNEPLSGVEFEIVDSLGNVIDTQTSAADGKVSFDNLNPGKYWIRETSQNPGYIIPKEPYKVIVGEKWKVPDNTEDNYVTQYFKMDETKKSTLKSTTGSEEVVYPNEQEGLFAELNYTIDQNVHPGDKFIMTLSDNVDLDGLSTIDDSEFDIYGPMGLLAVAKIREGRHSIEYTFTEALDYYNDLRSLTINTQMFINRLKVPNNAKNVEISIEIFDSTEQKGAIFNDTINVDYDNETKDGYISALENVKTYQLRLGTSSESPRYFTNVIYVNPRRTNDGNKSVTFSADIDFDVKSVNVYKTTSKSPANLPWSFKIDYSKLEQYGLEKVDTTYKKTDVGKILIDLPDEYSQDQYVIEVEGWVKDTGSFKTQTIYSRSSHYFKQQDHDYYAYTDEGWQTWTQEYNPDAQSGLEQEFYNYKNRIEFTKVSGKAKTNETEGTNPDVPNPVGSPGEEDKVTPLEGVKFELRKLGEGGEYVKEEGKEKESDGEGKFSWEGLPEGKYKVKEIETLEGYTLPKDGFVSSFEVAKDGNIVNILNGTTIIENYKEGMKFYLDKVWKDKNKSYSIKHGTLALDLTIAEADKTFPADVKVETEIPEGRKYKITKVSEDRKTITIEMSLKDAYEEVTINGEKKQAIMVEVPANWPSGQYSLTESKAPAGYVKTDKAYSLQVNNDANEIAYDKTTLYKKGTNGETLSILEIENQRGIFPNTGGPGVWIGFTVLGLAVMIAGVFLYNKRQARPAR